MASTKIVISRAEIILTEEELLLLLKAAPDIWAVARHRYSETVRKAKVKAPWAHPAETDRFPPK